MQPPSAEPETGLASLARQLPIPASPLHGLHAAEPILPDNIICFYHHSATNMNRPSDGRALHHRHVLMIALETAVTVCVDEQSIPLNAGEGLLVMPFQFHNYIEPAQEKITWLFVTFELAERCSLEHLRFRKFALTPATRQLVSDFLHSYLAPEEPEITLLIFALVLARIRQSELEPCPQPAPPPEAGLIAQINQFALKREEMPHVKEMARSLGISPSHLRARFRASCGVSLGKHLRRLRMEKACGLLRHSSKRVSHIAELCGFTSPFSFSRAFHSAYGISPLAYRQNGLNPEPPPAPKKKSSRATTKFVEPT